MDAPSKNFLGHGRVRKRSYLGYEQHRSSCANLVDLPLSERTHCVVNCRSHGRQQEEQKRTQWEGSERKRPSLVLPKHHEQLCPCDEYGASYEAANRHNCGDYCPEPHSHC